MIQLLQPNGPSTHQSGFLSLDVISKLFDCACSQHLIVFCLPILQVKAWCGSRICTMTGRQRYRLVFTMDRKRKGKPYFCSGSASIRLMASPLLLGDVLVMTLVYWNLASYVMPSRLQMRIRQMGRSSCVRPSQNSYKLVLQCLKSVCTSAVVSRKVTLIS
jgi:hypothetical protein